MNKFLLPYRRCHHRSYPAMIRRELNDQSVDGVGMVWYVDVSFNRHPYWANTNDRAVFSTYEEAAMYLDEILIARGYILIPKNEVERYAEKLMLLG